jgi:hypothetical protein
MKTIEVTSGPERIKAKEDLIVLFHQVLLHILYRIKVDGGKPQINARTRNKINKILSLHGVTTIILHVYHFTQ